MSRPNLFKYATSELSQDAFLCWLLDWANPEHRDSDSTLHRVGLYFLKKIFELHGKILPEIASVKIKKQYMNIDIFAVVTMKDDASEKKYGIIIEDKVHSSEHGNQLANYRNKAYAKEFDDDHLLCIYLKTGNQSDLSIADSAGYKYINRKTLLEILTLGNSEKSSDSIYMDYFNNLSYLDSEYNAYKCKKVTDWEWSQWEGFLSALHRALKGNSIKSEWGYISNPNGGFLGMWLHFIPILDLEDESGKENFLYLQLEFGRLCFRGILGKNNQFGQKRKSAFHDAILKAKGDLPISKPSRMRIGKATTCLAVWDIFLPMLSRDKHASTKINFYGTRETGMNDMEKVLCGIRQAQTILNAAVDILCQKNYRKGMSDGE